MSKVDDNDVDNSEAEIVRQARHLLYFVRGIIFIIALAVIYGNWSTILEYFSST